VTSRDWAAATLPRENAVGGKAAVKDPEERLRRTAVRRVLAGATAAEVAAELHRSERWVFKWLRRYDPSDDAWARSGSRAPAHVANETANVVDVARRAAGGSSSSASSARTGCCA